MNGLSSKFIFALQIVFVFSSLPSPSVKMAIVFWGKVKADLADWLTVLMEKVKGIVTSMTEHWRAGLLPQGQWCLRYQMVSFFNCGPKRGLSWARIAISQLNGWWGRHNNRKGWTHVGTWPFSIRTKKKCCNKFKSILFRPNLHYYLELMDHIVLMAAHLITKCFTEHSLPSFQYLLTKQLDLVTAQEIQYFLNSYVILISEHFYLISISHHNFQAQEKWVLLYPLPRCWDPPLIKQPCFLGLPRLNLSPPTFNETVMLELPSPITIPTQTCNHLMGPSGAVPNGHLTPPTSSEFK